MRERSIRLEQVFVFLAAIFGTLILVLTPPMQAPDENVHFVNAYSISKGDVFPEVYNGQVGKKLPANIYNFVTSYSMRRIDSENKYNYFEMNLLSYTGAESSGEELIYQNGSLAMNPIGYLFSSTGMLIFRVIGRLGGSSTVTPFNMLMSARIANFLVYLFLFFTAIKITPKFKNTMFLLGLMPMSIFLGASINYDAIVMPTCILLIAELLKIWNDSTRTVEKKDIAIVMFCTFFMVGIKMMYVPVLLLLVTVPMLFFKDKKTYFKIVGLVILAAIIAFIPKLFLGHAIQGMVSPYEIYAQSQKEYLVHHIGQIPSILSHTFIGNRMYFLTSFVGSLGNLDTNLPYPIILIYFVTLLVSLVVDSSNLTFSNWKIRLASVISLLVIVLGSAYTMYINWTSIPEVVGVGADYVSGLQGRYFIPVFILFGLAISNQLIVKWKKEHWEVVMRKYLVFIVGTVETIMMVLLFSRFWT